MAQSTASGTSSRRSAREHDVAVSSTCSTKYGDSEWETKEALRQRELEEARARAAQMEKTMRWWSDCTANWREKWSKVRNERNKAREEAKVLRSKLEMAIKDTNTFKHEKQEMESQNDQLKKEMEKIHVILLKHAGQFDQQIMSILEADLRLRDALGLDELLEVYNNVQRNEPIEPSTTSKELFTQKNSTDETIVRSENDDTAHDRDIEEYVLQGAVPKHAVELYKEGSADTSETDVPKRASEINNGPEKLENRQSLLDASDEEFLMQKMSMLHLRLEEASKTISAEREEKSSLHRGMEKLRAEVTQLRERCEELHESRAEVTRELLVLKDRFQTELSAAQADLMDEASNRESMDRRLSDLRTELERLQAENAAEWGKRERLETEKISLERENKQLRNDLREMQERVESRRARPVSASDTDVRQIQQELIDRSKEMSDLKHSYSKLKKMLGEKTTELSHAMRRSEQYEAEVKRVRARVEELKRELAAAQDELDTTSNNVRRLQRANEDLCEQLGSANVQIEHFKNRSRNPPGMVPIHHGSGISHDVSDEDINDF